VDGVADRVDRPRAAILSTATPTTLPLDRAGVSYRRQGGPLLGRME
jgi:hypothetical protein